MENLADLQEMNLQEMRETEGGIPMSWYCTQEQICCASDFFRGFFVGLGESLF